MSRSIEIQWRQGDILLSHDAFREIGVSVDSNTFAIVISHDCDIANDEPDVELIIGNFITNIELDGNYMFAKHLRILHFSIENDIKFIELKANKKALISKKTLKKCIPDNQYVLTFNQREILQDWLSARYKRQAIPDALKDRLNPFLSFIEKKGKKNNKNVLGYWVQYDPKNDELPITECYDFSLFIVYSIDNLEYQKEAQLISEEIKKDFSKILMASSHLGPVRLLKCEAYSEQEFTLRDMRQNVSYRFDHLSNRTDPFGPKV